MIDVEVGEPDEREDVGAEDLCAAVVLQADAVVGPGEVVDHVGNHGALHDVEAVDVQQTEASHNLCKRGKRAEFFSSGNGNEGRHAAAV